MEKLNELVELAKEMVVLHGAVWSSALCESGSNGQALRHHAIISDEKNDFVIDTGSDTNEASWLCDYLELCSPANILAIAEAFRELEQRAEAAEADKSRMDWLESKAVNVRQPLPYGSHNIFWAQQTSDDCDEHYTTDLREQIDNAILSEGANHD